MSKPFTMDELLGFLLDATGQPQPENMRRALACVNACAGIPTEALEAGALADMLAAFEAFAKWNRTPDACVEPRTQCDECERLLFAAVSQLEAAIAKLDVQGRNKLATNSGEGEP